MAGVAVERQEDGSLLLLYPNGAVQRFVLAETLGGVLFRYLGKWYVAA
jgi:hypothetical protein